jgi:BASS family bile acid:Na+ symporter
MFDSYPDYEQILARTQLVLFMLGMGSTLAVADFLQIGKKPRSLIVGLIGQMLITPLIAFAIGWVAGLGAGITTGLVLVASLPGGSMSKMFAYIARGNIALSITMSAFGTLLCIATIPLAFRYLAAGSLPSDFTVPVELVIVNELVLFLVLPLVGGMLFARYWPLYQLPFSRWTIRVGFVVAAVMVTGSLGSGRIDVTDYGWSVPLAVILFCILNQQVPMLPFRLLGWPDEDCVSVGIESTMRNINLSLALIALLFPAGRGSDPVGDAVLFVALYYGGTAFFFTVPLTLRLRRVIRRKQLAAMPQAETAVTPAGEMKFLDESIK